MYSMFLGSKFNGDISQWNVSKVECMDNMFKRSEFKGDISEWNVSSLRECDDMFEDCSIDIPEWGKYEDPEIRKKDNDAYHLSKRLNEELSINSSKTKKPKI
jgi:hypothetical protein